MSALEPRQITWETIEKSRNPAVLPLLAAGLASTSQEIRMKCLQALLARPEANARTSVILAWEKFSATEIEFIRGKTSYFQHAALEILVNGTLSDQRCAMSAITGLLLTGCLPRLLQFVLDPEHALQPLANECLQKLCVHWGTRARDDKDVPSVRSPMLETLYACLLNYPTHKNVHIVDAWLALVHWDDSLQRGLLADPGHCAFRIVVQRFKETQDVHLTKLLAGYLLRATTPKSIQTLACEKTDPQMALELAAMVDTHHWTNLKRRLRELPSLACLQSMQNDFQDKCLGDKKRLWLLLSVSSNDYGQVLRGAVTLAKLGNAEGRQIAAEMLRNCRKPEFEVIVGDLQSALAGIANANSAGSVLLETVLWAQSASLPLQRAATEFFEEFTVERLINQVAHWPISMCKAMAHVVSLTNTDITGFLVKQLESPSPKRRLAALRTTQMLSHSESVSQYLLPMLDDARLEVRVRVIDLLSELDGEVLERYIPIWLNDVSTDIQEAAMRVMRRRDRLKKTQSSERLATGESYR